MVGARGVGQRHDARRDGAPARLLLPGDRQQVHLSGPGIEAQGAAVPGLAMYLLIGRTEDYAWSLTSASHDVRDVFVEVLCEPDGVSADRRVRFTTSSTASASRSRSSMPARSAACPISYPVSVHGPVIGTATVDGRPVALTRAAVDLRARRPEPRRAQGHDRGRCRHRSEDVLRLRQQVRLHLQLGLRQPRGDRLLRVGTAAGPCRGPRPTAPDARQRASTSGRGSWSRTNTPTPPATPTGRLLNWNNQSAPGFMHGDDTSSTARCTGSRSFDQWPDRLDLADVVGVMNRSATEDARSSVWPVVREVLASGDAPSPLAGRAS